MKTLESTKLVLMLIYSLSLISTVRAQGAAPDVIAPGQLNLMPVPASVRPQSGRLPINGSFKVAVKDYADDRLRAGIARMLARLAGRTVLTLAGDLAADESTATLVVQCERAGDTLPSPRQNQSYNFDLPPKQARLSPPP